MSERLIKSKYPHIYWIDLNGDNTLTECAVVKQDPHGSVYFISLQWLDHIDKIRLRDIIMNRNANHFPLWELMQQNTLGNGINALTYFHQLVKVLTPQGKILDPIVGQVGIAGTGKMTKPDAVVPAVDSSRAAHV